MTKPLPKEYKEVIGMRNQLISYCTEAGRRLDVGVGMEEDYIIDKIVSDREKAKGIDYKINAYASAEFIISKDKEKQMINLVDAFRDAKKEELSALGFHTQYGRLDSDFETDEEVFVVVVEVNELDYQKIKYPLSKLELDAMEAREERKKIIGEDSDINRKLYEKDRSEYDDKTEKQIPVSPRRHY